MIKTWKNKKGNILKISDMSTLHIKNCLTMLENKNYVNHEEYMYIFSIIPTFNGEIAQITAEQEQDRYLQSNIPCKEIDWFEEELKNRGIND